VIADSALCSAADNKNSAPHSDAPCIGVKVEAMGASPTTADADALLRNAMDVTAKARNEVAAILHSDRNRNDALLLLFRIERNLSRKFDLAFPNKLRR
jgi:hypothetical protein